MNYEIGVLSKNNSKPHQHMCEIKMIKNKYWKKYCPYNGKLSLDEHECDSCNHLIIVEFKNDNMLEIENIIRYSKINQALESSKSTVELDGLKVSKENYEICRMLLNGEISNEEANHLILAYYGIPIDKLKENDKS